MSVHFFVREKTEKFQGNQRIIFPTVYNTKRAESGGQGS